MNEFSFDGRQIAFEPGMTIASALLIAGVKSLRTTQVNGVPRGPFCMMGSCFDCLVIVDGEPNQQACQIEAQPGMQVLPQPAQTELLAGEL
ncbi:MAG: (2Fe-2S)-binding protein [Gammaproteobacteria bacterium]|nr:(2Fe-2S)-binding protein [Gammaproteobacteria bacterium]